MVLLALEDWDVCKATLGTLSGMELKLAIAAPLAPVRSAYQGRLRQTRRRSSRRIRESGISEEEGKNGCSFRLINLERLEKGSVVWIPLLDDAVAGVGLPVVDCGVAGTNLGLSLSFDEVCDNRKYRRSTAICPSWHKFVMHKVQDLIRRKDVT